MNLDVVFSILNPRTRSSTVRIPYFSRFCEILATRHKFGEVGWRVEHKRKRWESLAVSLRDSRVQADWRQTSRLQTESWRV